MTTTAKMTCGACGGGGRTSEWNGYQKWDEICYQCRGRGHVIVLVAASQSEKTEEKP